MKLPPRPLLIARNQNDEATFCNASSLAAYHINCHTEQCECIHVIRVPLNATVELILVDETRPMVDGSSQSHHQHPFHLHGYDFRVVGMERVKTTIGITVDEVSKPSPNYITSTSFLRCGRLLSCVSSNWNIEFTTFSAFRRTFVLLVDITMNLLVKWRAIIMHVLNSC